MLKRFGILLVVGLLALVAVIIRRPADFHCERSTSIAAGDTLVYSYIEDFHQWGKWSPWEDKDPAMKKTFTGAPHGVDSEYAWTGNNDVGEGSMAIDKAEPATLVHIKLEMFRPVKNASLVTFSLRAADDRHTLVSWAMDSQQDFFGKAAGLFMDMEKMIGSDFEVGLARLKKVAEAAESPGPAPAKP